MRPEQILAIFQLYNEVTNTTTLRDEQKRAVLAEIWRNAPQLALSTTYPITKAALDVLFTEAAKTETSSNVKRGKAAKEAPREARPEHKPEDGQA